METQVSPSFACSLLDPTRHAAVSSRGGRADFSSTLTGRAPREGCHQATKGRGCVEGLAHTTRDSPRRPLGLHLLVATRWHVARDKPIIARHGDNLLAARTRVVARSSPRGCIEEEKWEGLRADCCETLPAGTSIEALADFIKQFYSRAAGGGGGTSNGDSPLASTSTAAASNSTAARTQKIDDAFVTFVWNALVDLPDVRVGVLNKIEKPAAAAAAAQDEDTPMAGTLGADDAAAAEMNEPPKGRRKKIERKAQGPTHEMRILSAEERELGRDALTEKYGDQLRVLSGEETTWVAITGSHLRVRFDSFFAREVGPFQFR